MRELGGRRARRVMAGGEEGELGDGRPGQLRDPVREVPGSDDQAGGVDPKWRQRIMKHSVFHNRRRSPK